MSSTVEHDVGLLAKRAAAAAAPLARCSAQLRDDALTAMAQALRENAAAIVEANEGDMDAARHAGTDEALLDRLMLDTARVDAMAAALDDLRVLSDPLGRVLEARTLYNGMDLTRISVPLGVVGIIYEARPNVTADAAGICIKSGNACILRGGSLAARSNEVIADVLAQAACAAGLPDGCICAITTTDRSATDALMQLHGLVDVIIPRGGAGLIRHCMEHSRVPVIETGTGNCHVYLHASADACMAHDIVMNAKCRRYGVCNAAESLVVDNTFDPEALGRIIGDLVAYGVTVHGDERICVIARQAGVTAGVDGAQVVQATDADWGTEYLGPEISAKMIDGGVDEAIDHINRYGTGHSEAIVASDEEVIEAFLAGVDAAAVYANASTAFTDGGQFGMGAEIGISTQKLHARGPFALDALTSYKYVLRGNGQVRA